MKKVAIIGASSGIGKALALKFVGEGHRVGIAARREELLRQIEAQYPKEVVVQAMDCTQNDVPVKFNALVAALGGMDIMVFASGTGDFNPSLGSEITARTNQLNVVAFAKICALAFNHFKAQGRGHLVNISSIAGLRGGRHAPSYSASKAYQIIFLEGLRQKAAKENAKIRLTDVRPGFVATAMAKGEGQFWVATPKKAAHQIYRAVVKKREVAYITKRWRSIAIVLKILPTWLHKKL